LLEKADRTAYIRRQAFQLPVAERKYYPEVITFP